MEEIKCSRRGCNRPAVIYQRYSGLHLCEKHFIEYIERKVKKELRRQMGVERGDRIAVALSGGKDSSALIYMLNKFFHDRRDLQFVAIAVDEGIKGFRRLTLDNAEKLTKKLNMELFTYSFAHEFGFTLDDIVSKGFEQAPCTFCGVLRRRVIERKAKELGITKVFTAHNLDDEVQTIMLNYIRGDIERLRRLNMHRIDEFVPRIKPLRTIPEKEIGLYAYLVGLPLLTAHCPYARLSFRFSVKRMLNEFEMRHPGAKYSLLRGYEHLMELLPASTAHQRRLLTCERCGEASASKLCKVCEIIARMKMHQLANADAPT